MPTSCINHDPFKLRDLNLTGERASKFPTAQSSAARFLSELENWGWTNEIPLTSSPEENSTPQVNGFHPTRLTTSQ